MVTIGPREDRKIIAEARYMINPGDFYPDVAFMVDENYRGHGLASALLRYLEEIAKETGDQRIQGGGSAVQQAHDKSV